MKKFVEAFRRIMKALEEIPPEEVQEMLNQAQAQIQVIQHRKAEAEKRKLPLTQMIALSKMNNLRRTWNNRYTNCAIMGGF